MVIILGESSQGNGTLEKYNELLQKKIYNLEKQLQTLSKQDSNVHVNVSDIIN